MKQNRYVNFQVPGDEVNQAPGDHCFVSCCYRLFTGKQTVQIGMVLWHFGNFLKSNITSSIMGTHFIYTILVIRELSENTLILAPEYVSGPYSKKALVPAHIYVKSPWCPESPRRVVGTPPLPVHCKDGCPLLDQTAVMLRNVTEPPQTGRWSDPSPSTPFWAVCCRLAAVCAPPPSVDVNCFLCISLKVELICWIFLGDKVLAMSTQHWWLKSCLMQANIMVSWCIEVGVRGTFWIHSVFFSRRGVVQYCIVGQVLKKLEALFIQSLWGVFNNRLGIMLRRERKGRRESVSVRVKCIIVCYS